MLSQFYGVDRKSIEFERNLPVGIDFIQDTNICINLQRAESKSGN